jgi:hypothetical protein
VTFDGFGMIQYRDGSDGQGFHRDTDMRWLDDTLIAVLTLGAQRPWLLRPVQRRRGDDGWTDGWTDGRDEEATPDIDLAPASGDLLVLGGRAQADWLHSVAYQPGRRLEPGCRSSGGGCGAPDVRTSGPATAPPHLRAAGQPGPLPARRADPAALLASPAMNGVGRFRADIQGLRAIAVLVVVAFHADLALPGGFLGVDVFFAISGFVITGMLVAEQERTGRLALGRFYLRRIRRLLPALAAMVAVVLVLLPLLGPRSAAEATTRTAVAGSLFSANVQLLASAQGYFDPRTEANAFLHLWTLSVEEQFYLVFPLLLLGATRLGARRAVLGSAALVSSGLAVALAGGHVPGVETAGPRVAFYSAPTRAWEFLAGCLLALVVARGWSPSRAVADGCGAVGG